MVDNSDYQISPSLKEQFAEIGKQIQESLLPLIELGKRIESQFAPFQEQLLQFADNFPWWACERALEAAEEGDTEELNIFVQDYLGLGADEWPYAEEALREGLKRWRVAENPIHYVGAIAHRKKKWAHLDVDHKANGIQIHGSIFRKKKAEWNTEPEGVLSLDVMLEMDSRRVENDKEAWLDNDGILDNEPDGIISENELSIITENPDPFEHEGQADSIKQLLPRQSYKVKEWVREANYIQQKFVDGYYSKTFTLQDEQDKFVMSSFIPRLKRKGAAPNLTYSINDIVDAVESPQKATEQEYIKTISDSIDWPEYRSVRDLRSALVRVSDAGDEKVYTFKPWDCLMEGIFIDDSLDLRPELRAYNKIIGVGFVDIERLILDAGLSIDDVLVAKAWVLRPRLRYYDGAEFNQYRPGWFEVHMTVIDIAALLGWDNKRVDASIKRIKRAGNMIRPLLFSGAGEYIKMCGTCKHLEIKNKKKQDGGSYIRYYICKKGKKIKSLYGISGNCFEQGSTKDISDKMFSMTYFDSRKSKLIYK